MGAQHLKAQGMVDLKGVDTESRPNALLKRDDNTDLHIGNGSGRRRAALCYLSSLTESCLHVMKM